MARNTFDDRFETAEYGGCFRGRRVEGGPIGLGDVATDPFHLEVEVA